MSSRPGFAAVWFALAVIHCFSAISLATASDQPLWDELKRRTQSDVFTIGALLQVVGTYENDPPQTLQNGFVLANFRLLFKGKLDRSWGYFLQTSFIKSPAILDANVYFSPWGPIAEFRMGAFKTPFSAEFLISASGIDFVNRSQIVTTVIPGRQIGFQVAGRSGIGLGYAVGVFNGNGLVINNDNNELMTTGRVSYARFNDPGDRGISLGINAFQSNDANAPIGVPITGDFIAEGFAGQRQAAGADLRWIHDRWLVSSEFIATRYDPRGADRVEPWGYQVTLGYGVSDLVQLLARWDSLSLDGLADDSDQLILGLNYWPTKPTEIQLNTVIPTSTSRDPQLLVNVQVGF